VTKQRSLQVADQRRFGRMCWLTLHAPEIAGEVRAGQFLMVRCSEADLYEPFLRRALFVAASQPALGQIALLYAPEADPGLRWLARCQAVDTLDVLGPFGHGFELARTTKTLLLLGEGPNIAALLMLAHTMVARGGSVTLYATASELALLPPAFLLPSEIEYQTGSGAAVELLSQQHLAQGGPSTLVWADQLCAALPFHELNQLRDLLRTQRIRTDRSFASIMAESTLACGIGNCGACAVETRKGLRLACSEGPVFGLHQLIEG
jgi:dihydroorotate dehydrogenase electron transfer subunit